MEIPLSPSKTPDIYSYGFDGGLNRPIEDNSTGVVYDAVGDSLNAAQVIQGGNLTLKTLSIGGLVRQVAPSDNIQAAIDAVNRDGGGTVQLLVGTYTLVDGLTMRSNVSFLGSNIGQTILDFNNTGTGIQISGETLFRIANLTFQRSSTNGITATNCTNFSIKDCISSQNVASGYKFNSCAIFTFDNCQGSNNSVYGVYLDQCTGASFNSSFFSLNASHGVYLNATTGVNNALSINTMRSVSNTGGGFNIEATESCSFTSLYAAGNTSYAFYVGSSSTNNTFVSPYALNVNQSGTGTMFIASAGDVWIGPFGNFDFSADLADDHTTILSSGLTNSNDISNFGSAGGNFFVHGDQRYNRRSVNTTQSSGGAVPPGAVLVYSNTDPTKVTTTTVNGDNKVYGVSLDTIPNNSNGTVLTEGFTDLLYVNNSLASISIGDFLSTYSHAYYAKKAVAGDTVFAISMTAPTTSTATVSALLINPRLI